MPAISHAERDGYKSMTKNAIKEYTKNIDGLHS